ncbi:MAG TPA: hypothetical protein VGR67_05555 [Candidatus Polarisedimenticolia bacterium]|jgi:hypothetical protein|nr:hypothetical protein [Candidatus Polarisedimenticolia bacterium]
MKVLGAVLLVVGTSVAIWRVANLAVASVVFHDLPPRIVIQYFVATSGDALWGGFMAAAGYHLLRRRGKPVSWLIASAAAWIPATVIYAYQASGGERMARSFGISVGVLVLVVVGFRTLLLLPNLAAAVLMHVMARGQRATASEVAGGDPSK